MSNTIHVCINHWWSPLATLLLLAHWILIYERWRNWFYRVWNIWIQRIRHFWLDYIFPNKWNAGLCHGSMCDTIAGNVQILPKVYEFNQPTGDTVIYIYTLGPQGFFPKCDSQFFFLRTEIGIRTHDSYFLTFAALSFKQTIYRNKYKSAGLQNASCLYFSSFIWKHLIKFT